MKNESSQIDVRGTATEGTCMSRKNTTMNSMARSSFVDDIAIRSTINGAQSGNVNQVIGFKSDVVSIDIAFTKSGQLPTTSLSMHLQREYKQFFEHTNSGPTAARN
eukprot:scaffold34721_cov100-Skeletonema_marinoi.AAC.3